MELPQRLPDGVEALVDLEQRVEREWWWLNGALHAVAQVRADGPRCVEELREQQRNVDRVRVEIALRLALLKPRR
jgi:hypothetical protein